MQKPSIEFGEAYAVVSELLIEELIVTLQKRGLVTRLEIAGALLRAEHRANLIDEASEVIGRSRIATNIVENLESRNGLKPELYLLRMLRDEWLSGGEVGPHPFEENSVLRRARDIETDA